LNNPKMYAATTIQPGDSRKAVSGLSKEQQRKLISLGHWRKFDGKPRGYVNVFLVPEPWKRRYRVISHTFSTNRDVEEVPSLKLPTLNDARASIFQGSAAACVDMAQCFGQFELGELVRAYFVIITKHGYYSLGRLAMGQRQSCFIAQTALEILLGAPQTTVHKMGYIDNAKFTGDDKDVLSELRDFRDRAAMCGATFTEFKDQAPIAPLVQATVEFLGLRLDHSSKRVQLVDKAVEKLKLSWSKRSGWTLREWCNHVSILLYTYFALRYPLGRFEFVLKKWAAIQSQAYHDDSLWNGVAPEYECLKTWTEERIVNEWVQVHVDESPSFTLITDASRFGWCGILVSNTSGEYSLAFGEWNHQDGLSSDDLRKSSVTEPLGIVKSAQALINPNARITVDLVGDNKGTVDIINRGFSTRSRVSVVHLLEQTWPKVTFVSHHIAGVLNPADGPSRGVQLDEKLLEDYTRSKGRPFIRAK